MAFMMKLIARVPRSKARNSPPVSRDRWKARSREWRCENERRDNLRMEVCATFEKIEFRSSPNRHAEFICSLREEACHYREDRSS